MKFEIPERKKLVYEMHIPIRWGDMDAMKHVNNTVYFRYLETCRIDWMHSTGSMPGDAGEGPVIVNAFCNFYKQLEYPGDVLMKLLGGSLLSIACRYKSSLSPLLLKPFLNTSFGGVLSPRKRYSSSL